MRIESATLLYWSPTGTTRKVLSAVAEGMNLSGTNTINLTRPVDRKRPLPTVDGDVLLVGTPVYEERVPEVAIPYLRALHGRRQPAAAVAVYGNVGTGIVLQQLSSELTAKGFPVVAGATFVGEHSFSHSALPIAAGRPDEGDLEVARTFGRRLQAKLTSLDASAEEGGMDFPGHLPLKARLLPRNSARSFTRQPAVLLDRCIHCGACASVCPMGAIDPDSLDINESLCLRCFACVRACPQSARAISLKKRWLVRFALRRPARVPQQPSLYL